MTNKEKEKTERQRLRWTIFVWIVVVIGSLMFSPKSCIANDLVGYIKDAKVTTYECAEPTGTEKLEEAGTFRLSGPILLFKAQQYRVVYIYKDHDAYAWVLYITEEDGGAPLKMTLKKYPKYAEVWVQEGVNCGTTVVKYYYIKLLKDE